MPGFDGSGPRGFGPMTGWGRGYCNPGRGSVGSAWGRGSGFGRGGGWGRGFRRGGGFGWGRGMGPAWGSAYGPWGANPYNAVPYGGAAGMNPADEASYLKQEADAMRSELDAIQQRIEELESKESSS